MTITVTEFKAKCLGIIEKVQREKCRVLISRHGRIAAQLGPAPEGAEAALAFGRSAKETEILGDLLNTTESWDAEA